MLRLMAELLLIAGPALAQFVPAPTSLTTTTGYAGIQVRYKQVPTGICELDPNVKSFSGYADVDFNQHLFWWFFEARNVDPTTAPLTVWINGGPGSSSMIGLFQENGPCRINSSYGVVNNPYSWSNVSNMLFIDEPVGTGFSYGEAIPAYRTSAGDIVQLPSASCPSWPAVARCGTYTAYNISLTANSTANAAPNMWKALQGFMGSFPQYARNGFHFATESYGGHYGPVFNEYFKQQNKKNIKDAMKIDLHSVSIGNGWFSPLLQYGAYYNYSVEYNPYGLYPLSAPQQAQMYNAMYGPGNCADQLNYCTSSGLDEICSAADDFCASEVEEAWDTYAKRDEYDIRELTPDPFPPSFYSTYLALPAIQNALGVFVNFSDSSLLVGLGFGDTGDDGREDGTIEAMKKLLNQNVRVTMYTGDADYICNHAGTLAVADVLSPTGWKKAGWANVTTSDGVVNAQVKSTGNFSYVRVYYSGHEVPFYQPLLALEMFERIISGTDIETGKTTVTKSYRSVGTSDSTFQEGLGTVQYKTWPTGTIYNTTTHVPNGANVTNTVSKLVTASLSSRSRRGMQRFRRHR